MRLKTQTMTRSFSINFSFDELSKLFNTIGSRILLEKGQENQFEIDDMNRDVIQELIYYLQGDDKFSYDLNRGIIIMGSVGSGKTLLFNIIKEILTYIRKNFHVYSAIEINEAYDKKDNDLIQRFHDLYLLGIDDLGTENPSIKVYGTEKSPIYEVINRRYSTDKMLFITTNLDADEIQKRYGDRIRDRLKEMCNVLVLKGPSRRR